MEDLFLTEEPSPRTHAGRTGQISKLAPWVQAAMENPNTWYRWRNEASVSFQGHVRLYTKRHFPDHEFEITSRRITRGVKTAYVYLRYLGPKDNEPF